MMKTIIPMAAILCLVAALIFYAIHRHHAGGPVPVVKTVQATTILNLPPLPEEPPNRTILDHIENYVDVPKGAVDWKLFGQTTTAPTTVRDPNGQPIQYLQPRFSPAVKAMDGKTIAIKGFMFPLDEGDQQGEFLFGPFPVNCPYHYHVGPSLVLEVHADAHPVAFSYDAITVQGRLQLLSDNRDGTLFYRLLDARKID